MQQKYPKFQLKTFQKHAMARQHVRMGQNFYGCIQLFDT